MSAYNQILLAMNNPEIVKMSNDNSYQARDMKETHSSLIAATYSARVQEFTAMRAQQHRKNLLLSIINQAEKQMEIEMKLTDARNTINNWFHVRHYDNRLGNYTIDCVYTAIFALPEVKEYLAGEGMTQDKQRVVKQLVATHVSAYINSKN